VAFCIYLYLFCICALTKFRLDVEYDYDFLLAGISCHEKPYRLCWAVNRALEINMARTESLSIALKKNEPASAFPLFLQENPANDTSAFLVSNRSEQPGGLLVPEQQHADYFFIARGPYNDSDHERMLSELKKIPFILMSYRINPDSLKSKQNLLF
jgi:hypothetical protein